MRTTSFAKVVTAIGIIAILAVVGGRLIAAAPAGSFESGYQDGKYLYMTAEATCDPRRAINAAHCYTLAVKAARTLALEKIAEYVQSINLTSERTIGMEMLEDSVVKGRVNAVIRGAEEVSISERTRPEDGTLLVAVTVRIPQTGENGLTGVFLPWQREQGTQDKMFAPDNIGTATGSNIPDTPLNTPMNCPQDKSLYTSVIVDASGLGAKRAMFPRIVTESAGVVYNGIDIDEKFAVREGIVSYAGAVATAMNDERSGCNPLVIKAIGVQGQFLADLVVSDADAASITGADRQTGFLKRAAVIFVIGK